MAKFVVFFSYTAQTWHGMLDKPSDRIKAAGGLATQVGGSLESLYFMFGDWDGMAVFDTDGASSAAAISIAISSTGAFSRVETHELIESADLLSIMSKAKTALSGYTAPGG